MAAMAYQSTPHNTEILTNSWDHAVPLNRENLGLTNRKLYDAAYSYDPSQAPREPSNYGQRRPSQIATLDINSAQLDQAKRDSGRALKTDTSQHDRPDRSPNPSQTRRPSVPQAWTAASAARPRTSAEETQNATDRSAWIHRDKLARIESREMAEAGYPVHRTNYRRQSRSDNRSASRSTSRNPHMRARSGDRLTDPTASPDESGTPTLPVFEEPTSQPAKEDRESDEYEERLREEPRKDRNYSRSLPRPITSRIPIARASPAPLSQTVVERDSPLPRSWQGNTSLNGMPIRTRSRSLGSQAMIEESAKSRTPASSKPRPRSSHLQDSANTQSLGSTSSKVKPPAKYPTNSVGRKGTTPRTASKTRTPSGSHKDSPITRRPTSSSNRSRPTSFHQRPEGDAPWIAHMYKPDPRLPPDQQMLPTHAKRMLQGQWDKDGKTGDAYDKDFNLLNDNDLAKMGALPPPDSEIQQSEAASPTQVEPVELPASWPLTSDKGDTNSQTHMVSQGPNSGYTITPKIESPMPSPRPVAQPEASRPPKPVVQRVPDPDEKADEKTKKKSLACCVIM